MIHLHTLNPKHTHTKHIQYTLKKMRKNERKKQNYDDEK